MYILSDILPQVIKFLPIGCKALARVSWTFLRKSVISFSLQSKQRPQCFTLFGQRYHGGTRPRWNLIIQKWEDDLCCVWKFIGPYNCIFLFLLFSPPFFLFVQRNGKPRAQSRIPLLRHCPKCSTQLSVIEVILIHAVGEIITLLQANNSKGLPVGGNSSALACRHCCSQHRPGLACLCFLTVTQCR